MKGTENLSKKRARPAMNAKANQIKMMKFTTSSAEGVYVRKEWNIMCSKMRCVGIS